MRIQMSELIIIFQKFCPFVYVSPRHKIIAKTDHRESSGGGRFGIAFHFQTDIIIKNKSLLTFRF
jgi:hypothetical protein